MSDMGHKARNKKVMRQTASAEVLELINNEINRRAGSEATYEQMQDMLTSVLNDVAARLTERPWAQDHQLCKGGNNGVQINDDRSKAGLDE